MQKVCQCGKVIGLEVEHRGQIMLQTSIGPLYRLHGYCECGRQIHFDASDIKFRRLMRRCNVEVKEDE